MKSKNVSQYIIALTVVVCSLVLLGALTIAISGQRWGAHGRKLEIDFKDATGIKLHAAVRYAGAVSGTVVAMRYLTPEERAQPGKRDLAVRVMVRLSQQAPTLPSDVKVGISSETIMGEKFIALSAGTPGIAPLPEGAVIEGQSLSSIDTLTLTLEKTAATATEILQKFNGDYPELKTNLNHVLLSADTLLTTTTNLINDGRAAVGDVRGTLRQVDDTIAGARPQLSNLLSQTTYTVTNLNPTIDNARAITTDFREFLTNQFLANLDQNMRSLTSLLARTEITMEYAKLLAARLAEKPSRIIWQSRTSPVPSEAEIRKTMPAAEPRKSKN